MSRRRQSNLRLEKPRGMQDRTSSRLAVGEPITSGRISLGSRGVDISPSFTGGVGGLMHAIGKGIERAVTKKPETRKKRRSTRGQA